ncbi:response regulator transcription factor [Lachnobacterium bovis]|uniref:Stage 0 sporulation protein A homolog n=1 Tax=Lachnobacterium bovis DSM 14045 TaxID=1122142 RepID=A0A1H3JQ64_9FIRM|nr:response regulator transcription factor [Lachnobacterium bovis]SDY42120.1 DNA-binding response regulator, OmpR family, contains REC and winged-helix (wHTH) domain [Lachnobacterium bovis DSM 14045]
MSEKKYEILVAEDDADIVELMVLYLENSNYNVLKASDGVEAYEVLKTNNVDLAIVDIMMPKMNGYELIKKIRETSNIPIIIVSAKNSDSDKILGLDLGADDYVVKPFNTLELVSRVNSNLRRFYDFNDNKGRESEILKVGELELDTNNLILKKNKNEIELTPTEYKIVSLLMKKPGRVFTKVQIYENVKGEYFEADDNTIMVHISKIREKIEEDSHNPKYIKTVRGLGYKIENIK